MKITKPGIYRNIDVLGYHADPCPEPSLSQSLAKILIERSPLHAKLAHPRLTPPDPNAEPEDYKAPQVIGDAAHALMIGRGKDLAVAPFDSWRTKEAQKFKTDAIAAGKLPIREEHFNKAHEIMRAAVAQIEQHDENDCFKDGAGEVALIWQEGPLWFRCLVDWLHDDLLTVEDYKTTGMSVAPHVLGALAANAGWDIQAAMIERGLNALDPKNAGRRKLRFVAQEQDAPHALNVVLMSEYWLTLGRKRLQFAVNIWSRCIEGNRWHGYPTFAITPEYPGYRESAFLQRETEQDENMDRGPMLTSIAGG